MFVVEGPERLVNLWERARASDFSLAERVIDRGRDKDIGDLFGGACWFGNFEMVKWMYSRVLEKRGRFPLIVKMGTEQPPSFTYEFIWSCQRGHLEISKWLLQVFDIDPHGEEDRVLIVCCMRGALEVAKWIYAMGGVTIEALSDSLEAACLNNQAETVKWLTGLGLIDVKKIWLDYAEELAVRDTCVQIISNLFKAANGDLDLNKFYERLGYCEPSHSRIRRWVSYVKRGYDPYFSTEVDRCLMVVDGLGLPNELEREVLEWCGWR